MPRLADLRRQHTGRFPTTVSDVVLDESFVSDVRSQISSADVVDQKVGAALGVCFWSLGGRRGAPRNASSRFHRP